MAEKPRVTVVIPTWNRVDLVTECLESLRGQTCQTFRTIVVDDGSTDGTREVLADKYPEARVIRLERNAGFAVAANAGIREAGTEFVFLLNNDMTLDPQCIGQLLRAADTTGAALIAPVVLWKDEPSRIYSAGDRQRCNGLPEAIGFREPLEGFQFPQEIFGVSAGAGLYRREVFDRVGLLDEWFIAYFEDSDLSFRARLAGYTAALATAARAFHVGSATLAGRTWWRTRQCYRNEALLVIKNMPAPLLLRHAPAILAERLKGMRRVLSAARCEFGLLRAMGILAGAWCSILRALPHALRERRRSQSSRTITLPQLEQLLK